VGFKEPYLALRGVGGAGDLAARRVPQPIAVGLGSVQRLEGVFGVGGWVARLVPEPVTIWLGGVQQPGGPLIVAVGLTCRQ